MPSSPSSSQGRTIPSNTIILILHTIETKSSTQSMDSAATVESVHSLLSLVKQISDELYPQETLVRDLRAWLSTIDPEEYEQVPWSEEVQTAYNNYKLGVERLTVTHQAYMRDRAVQLKNATPEQHLERSRLAVAWGESAVKCVFFLFFSILTMIPTKRR